MRTIYDLLAIISFMIFCFIGGSEEISMLGNLVFGALSLATCYYFVRLSFKYDKKQTENESQKRKYRKAA